MDFFRCWSCLTHLSNHQLFGASEHLLGVGCILWWAVHDMVSCSLMFSADCCFLSQFTIYWSTQGYNLGCIVCRTPVGLCGRIEYSVRCVAHMADWRLVPHIWKYWLLCPRGVFQVNTAGASTITKHTISWLQFCAIFFFYPAQYLMLLILLYISYLTRFQR